MGHFDPCVYPCGVQSFPLALTSLLTPHVTGSTECINLADDCVPFAYLHPRDCNQTTCKRRTESTKSFAARNAAQKWAFMLHQHVTDAKMHQNGYLTLALSAPARSARVSYLLWCYGQASLVSCSSVGTKCFYLSKCHGRGKIVRDVGGICFVGVEKRAPLLSVYK